MESLKNYLTLSKESYFIVLSKLLNSVGAFVAPFITLILASQLGLDKFVIGTLVSVNVLASFIGTLLSGYVVDRLGARNTSIIFHSIHGLLYLLGAFLLQSYLVIMILILASFFSGIQSPTSSLMIYDNTKKEDVRVAFSLNYIGMNVGYTLGPLIAAWLYKNYMQMLFVGDAVTSFLSVVILYLAIKNKKVEKGEDTKETKNSLFRILINNNVIRTLVIVNLLYFIAFSQSGYGVPITIKELFGESYGPTLYSLTLTINAALCFILTPIITMISKKYSAKVILIISGLLYGVGFGMFGFIKLPFLFILATIIWTIGEILSAITFDPYILESALETDRSRAASFGTLARRGGMLIGPIFAGFLNEYFGEVTMWLVVALAAISGTILLSFSIKKD